MLNATKAAFLMQFAQRMMDDGGWLRKYVSFSADGASVNMGTCGGVIAHMQSEAGSHIIAIHCMPHRFVFTITHDVSVIILGKKHTVKQRSLIQLNSIECFW